MMCTVDGVWLQLAPLLAGRLPKLTRLLTPPARPSVPQLDPSDSRRLAFHLGCSWSGVLDLCR